MPNSRIIGMSKIISFSVSEEWTCLEKLMNILPRKFNTSKAIKSAIEEKLQRVEKNPISLDDFKDEVTTPRLDADSKIWNQIMKSMDNSELRKLQKQIQTKLNIVNDEIYRRTA